MPDTDRGIALDRLRSELVPGRKVVLTTHINADGDGAGSETALGHFLARKGLHPTIVNPTPFPEQFAFLVEGLEVHTSTSSEGKRALDEADLVLVLDTSEPSRLAGIPPRLRGRRVAVIDHHPPTPTSIGDPAIREPGASATGELVFDLLEAESAEIRPIEAMGLYVAIATDTGSFRYANTKPRTHEIVAALLRAGVDPEAMYRRLYAQYTKGRLELISRALSRLHVHEEMPIAWIRLEHADLAETGTTKEDLEGIVEFPRRIRGVEVAILLRELGDGRTKVSLRSTGSANVAAIARGLGGGGHEKAAGVVVDKRLEEAERVVLAAVADTL
jgi:phosphoesterase RecJ-like protein